MGGRLLNQKGEYLAASYEQNNFGWARTGRKQYCLIRPQTGATSATHLFFLILQFVPGIGVPVLASYLLLRCRVVLAGSRAVLCGEIWKHRLMEDTSHGVSALYNIFEQCVGKMVAFGLGISRGAGVVRDSAGSLGFNISSESWPSLSCQPKRRLLRPTH